MNTIKEFLKLNRWKVVATILIAIFIGLFTGSGYLGMIPIPDNFTSCWVGYGGCEEKEGGIICVDGVRANFVCLIIDIVVSLILYYLLVCLVYFIIARIKGLKKE